MITDKIIYLDGNGKEFNITSGNRLMALSDEQEREAEALKNDSKVIELKASSQTIAQPTVEQPLQTETFESVGKEEPDPINLIDPAVLQGMQVVDNQPSADNVAPISEPVVSVSANEPISAGNTNVNNENLNPVIDLGSQVVTDNVSEPIKEATEVKEVVNSSLQTSSSDNNEIMRGIMEINAERNKEIARLTKEIANVNALFDGKIISFINSKKKILTEKEVNNNSQDVVMNSPEPVANDNIVVMPQNTMVSSESNQPNSVINFADYQSLNNDDFARTLKVS